MGHVMVVDDDADVRDAVADVFRDEGCTVDTASDGWEALVRLGRTSEVPDLIITDLMMPRMDGWAFCRCLKEDPELANVPLAVLTAFAGDNDETHPPLEHSGARVIRKPLNLNALLELLDVVR